MILKYLCPMLPRWLRLRLRLRPRLEIESHQSVCVVTWKGRHHKLLEHIAGLLAITLLQGRPGNSSVLIRMNSLQRLAIVPTQGRATFLESDLLSISIVLELTQSGNRLQCIK